MSGLLGENIMRKLLLLSGLAIAASSQAASDSVYFKVDAGPSWVQDVSIKNSGGVKMETDIGLRADVGVGYMISPCWAVGLESGVAWNAIDKFSRGSASAGIEGDLYQVPLMLKAVYNFKLGSDRFGAFIGGGAGGIWTSIDADPRGGAGTGGGGGGENPPPTQRLAAKAAAAPGSHFGDDDVTFGFEGFAGFKFAIAKQVDLGVAYKFMGSLDHEFNDGGAKMKTDEIFTHSVVAMLGFRF